MPLPSNNTPWTPATLKPLLADIDTWSAWYSGDPAALNKAYRPGGTVRPSQRSGGVAGALSRFWWGRPQTNLAQPRDQIHIPVAGDLCQASADLLFSDPVTLTVTNAGTQDRLEQLVDDGLHSTLAEAAEVAAGLTGAFLRVTWSAQLLDRPFLSVVHPDAAHPDFAYGRLTGVTFWHVLANNGNEVLRHVERHEQDPAGNGIILHGLYRGTPDNLGRQIDLNNHPATAGLDPAINTGPGLAVAYVPNIRPQRKWRTHTLGRNYGRSDLDGIEGLMDQLDMTWASWMRDIRLGRSRVFAPESMLETLGPGQGGHFDSDREVFTALNVLSSSTDGGRLPIEAHQFTIRVTEHRDTVNEILANILRTAGYSAATFGLDGEAMATATEVNARRDRSNLTRDRKIREWRPAIAGIIEKLLQIDSAVFRSGVEVERPTVQFADASQESMLTLATTAQMLRGAEAASTKTLVEMVHPDWDDTQVTEELALIEAGKPAVPDPFTFRPGVDDQQDGSDIGGSDLDSDNAGQS